MNIGQPAIRLHPDDNIVVAARDLDAGTILQFENLQVNVTQPIQIGHKIAIKPIRKSAAILKFGQMIGDASTEIQPGEWVHSHNLELNRLSEDYERATAIPEPPSPITDRTFQGYRRPGGKTGTRNYLCVISTVNCSANVSKQVAAHFTAERLEAFPNVDGVFAITHQSGCGLKLRGSIQTMLNRVLGGFARHPNVGGYLIIGLGCEQNAAAVLMQDEQLVQIGGDAQSLRSGAGHRPQRPIVLTMQELGGTARTIQAGIEAVNSLLPQVNAIERETIPASEIILGTNCGGSDGNSGVTANPALGYASDKLIACGGTSVLAETSEIYGAEHLLTRRAVTAEVADKLLERIQWWHWYAGLYGEKLDNNPSIGNKAGGLTTIAEKSLGAVAKGGTTRLCDVVQYAEEIRSRGLVIMDTPGFDPPSVTGLVAGGANMIVFTTGRGSCFGCKPVPSIKVASNTPMYLRMQADMDLNAGTILDGETVEQVGDRIFEEILAVASGKPTKSEALGIGEDEFVPWTVGPVL
jgi:altronate hydrolase